MKIDWIMLMNLWKISRMKNLTVLQKVFDTRFIQWGASFRWSFGLDSAWGGEGSIISEKTRSTLVVCHLLVAPLSTLFHFRIPPKYLRMGIRLGRKNFFRVGWCFFFHELERNKIDGSSWKNGSWWNGTSKKGTSKNRTCERGSRRNGSWRKSYHSWMDLWVQNHILIRVP